MTKEITAKECLIRAMRTFIQAALGYVVANGTAVLMGAYEADMVKSAFMGLFVSAVAAGLAAIMNIPRKGGAADE